MAIQSLGSLAEGIQRGMRFMESARGNPLAEAKFAESVKQNQAYRDSVQDQIKSSALNREATQLEIDGIRQAKSQSDFDYFMLEMEEQGGISTAMSDPNNRKRYAKLISRHPEAQSYLGEGNTLVDFESIPINDEERLSALGMGPTEVSQFLEENGGGSQVLIPMVQGADGSVEPLEDTPGEIAAVSDISAFTIGQSLFRDQSVAADAVSSLSTGEIGGEASVNRTSELTQPNQQPNQQSTTQPSRNPMVDLPISQAAMESANQVAPQTPSDAPQLSGANRPRPRELPDTTQPDANANANRPRPRDLSGPTQPNANRPRPRNLSGPTQPDEREGGGNPQGQAREPIAQLGNPNPAGVAGTGRYNLFQGEGYQDKFNGLVERIVQMESGGRQTGAAGSVNGQDGVTESDAGAVGVMQVMPGTAKDVASDLGIEWDEKLYRGTGDEAEAYNRKLGTEYLRQKVEEYQGDAVLGALAYHSGAGNVNKELERIGDPRKGEVTHAQFIRRLKGPKGQEYAAKVAGVELPGEASTSIGRRNVSDKPTSAGTAKRAAADPETMEDIANNVTEEQVVEAADGLQNSVSQSNQTTFRVNSTTGRPTPDQLTQALRLVSTGYLTRDEFSRYADTGVISSDSLTLVRDSIAEAGATARSEIAQRQQTEREALQQRGQTEREAIKTTDKSQAAPDEYAETASAAASRALMSKGLDEDFSQKIGKQLAGTVMNVGEFGLGGKTDWSADTVGAASGRLYEKSRKYTDTSISEDFGNLFSGRVGEAIFGVEDPQLYKDPVALALETQNPVIFDSKAGIRSYLGATQTYMDKLNAIGQFDRRNDSKLRAQIITRTDANIRREGGNWGDEDDISDAMDAAFATLNIDTKPGAVQ